MTEPEPIDPGVAVPPEPIEVPEMVEVAAPLGVTFNAVSEALHAALEVPAGKSLWLSLSLNEDGKSQTLAVGAVGVTYTSDEVKAAAGLV